MAEAIKAGGYSVVEAGDGQEALDALEQHPDVKAVIADFNMPRMDGIEMIERLRADSRFTDLPVFILTTETSPQVKARAKTLRVLAWIIKPVSHEKLLDVLRKLVPRSDA